MSSPSIVPNDRLDKDFYLVLENFRAGPAFRETDEGVTYTALIDDLLTGQYDQVLRIVAFNPVEGWSRDASEDVAGALETHIAAEGVWRIRMPAPTILTGAVSHSEVGDFRAGFGQRRLYALLSRYD